MSPKCETLSAESRRELNEKLWCAIGREQSDISHVVSIHQKETKKCPLAEQRLSSSSYKLLKG